MAAACALLLKSRLYSFFPKSQESSKTLAGEVFVKSPTTLTDTHCYSTLTAANPQGYKLGWAYKIWSQFKADSPLTVTPSARCSVERRRVNAQS
nr:hypothetical protein Iba_chr03fCG4110 [Ipomoea batatas]